jgi:hypothetical protein
LNIEKISHWIQIVSGLALLVGLYLVLLELRQTKELTQATLTSESHSVAMARHAMLAGENPMRALAKACDPTATLTMEEALILDTVYRSLFQLTIRSWEIERNAQFGNNRWQTAAAVNFGYIFATQAGRNWWETADLRIPEIVQYTDGMLENIGPPSCEVLVGGILKTNQSIL